MPWLEFQMMIPGEFRSGKELFIRTVREVDPSFYQSERAYAMGYVPDWRSEIRNNLSMLRKEYLNRQPLFGLDSLIPPASIRLMIEREIIPALVKKKVSFYQSVLRKFNPPKPKPAPSLKKIIHPEKLVLRYLVLSGTLEKIREMRAEG
jgi:hypothetical protein